MGEIRNKVSLSTTKSFARQYGYDRWPYRKYREMYSKYLDLEQKNTNTTSVKNSRVIDLYCYETLD